jgi:hypothetical protein
MAHLLFIFPVGCQQAACCSIYCMTIFATMGIILWHLKNHVPLCTGMSQWAPSWLEIDWRSSTEPISQVPVNFFSNKFCHFLTKTVRKILDFFSFSSVNVTTFAKFLENSLIKKLRKSWNFFSTVNVTNFANFLVENHQILYITKLKN